MEIFVKNNTKTLGGAVDFKGFRDFIDAEWRARGLKDYYIRDFRAELLSADVEQEDDLINRALLTRNNQKFMELVNLGLPLDYGSFEQYSANKLKRREQLPSFLHQAIEKGDLDRVQLLLSAGAKPTINALDPFNDTFQYCIFSKKPDVSIFASILSYIDEQIDSHWALDVLCLRQLKNYKYAEPFILLLIGKLEEQGIDAESYARENTHKYILHFNKGGLDSVEHNLLRQAMQEADSIHRIC